MRRWKLTDEDWRNREKAREYERAADEMFDRTDHGLGPWDLIPARTSASRVAVIETVIARVEEGMARHGMAVPGDEPPGLIEAADG